LDDALRKNKKLKEEEIAYMGDLWYVATMNNGLFIIDHKPAPAPVDYVNTSIPAPSLVIPLRHNDRVTQEVAEQIVSEHNAALLRAGRANGRA